MSSPRTTLRLRLVLNFKNWWSADRHTNRHTLAHNSPNSHTLTLIFTAVPLCSAVKWTKCVLQCDDEKWRRLTASPQSRSSSAAPAPSAMRSTARRKRRGASIDQQRPLIGSHFGKWTFCFSHSHSTLLQSLLIVSDLIWLRYCCCCWCCSRHCRLRSYCFRFGGLCLRTVNVFVS